MGIVANDIPKRIYKETGYESNDAFIGLEIAFAHMVRYARDESAIPEGFFDGFQIENEPTVGGTYGTTIIGTRNGVTLRLYFTPKKSNEIPAYVDEASGNTDYYPYFSFTIFDNENNGIYGNKYYGNYTVYPGISLHYVEGSRREEAVGEGYDENQPTFDRVSLEVMQELVTRFNGF